MNEESKKLYLVTILSGKWRLIIIEQLFDGGKQFTDLKNSVAVSKKVLIENLQFLVKYGIVKRRSYPTFPPKVEYSLSERGKTLRPILDSIYQWSLENYTAIKFVYFLSTKGWLKRWKPCGTRVLVFFCP